MNISENRHDSHHRVPGPVITISRECGCSAKRIAIKLSKILTGYSYISDTKTEVEWKWVSKEIIDEAAKELSLHPDEVRNVLLSDVKTSSHEASSTRTKKEVYSAEDQKVIDTLKDVIMRIAKKGHYIIVGRAAVIIAKDIPGNINIKLQAPFEWRVNRIMQISNLSYSEAEVYVKEIDRQRELYVEHVAGRKLENSDYDMIFNYATMLDDHIVDSIVSVLKNKRIIIHSEEDY